MEQNLYYIFKFESDGMNTNPIYIVDDDLEDQDIIKEVLDELKIVNEVRFFLSAESVLTELKTVSVTPFIIICDIHLPKMDGFELRNKMLEEASIAQKAIPFIFWSTTASDRQIKRAYELSAHGFFLKAKTFGELKKDLQEIVRYWSDSLVPK